MNARADVTRRQLLATLAAAAVVSPRSSSAQPARVFRIGYLGIEPAPSPYLESFREGLRQLGHVEGRAFTIDARFADGKAERLAVFAAELVGQKVDVIVGITGGAAQAVRKSTTTIPLVAGFSGDPVETGLVASLARPGGNVTGMTYLQPDLATKRLQLLKDVLPKLARVTALANPDHAGESQEWRALDSAAKSIGVTIQRHMMPAHADLTDIFTTVTADRPDALVLVPGPMTNVHRRQLADFGIRTRVPVMAGWSEYADAGALVTYGPSRRDIARRLAGFVERIMKGDKPGDLPMERPTRFELVVNQKTARAIGVTIPSTLLLQADQVID
jgi:putative ABC transport system substrate-binding protein